MVVKPTVFILDGDPDTSEALARPIEGAGYHVRLFATPGEFLDVFHPRMPGCLLTEIELPEMSGLDLQVRLAKQSSILPVIVTTANGDVKSCVRAFHAGAFDFMEKPVDVPHLLERIAEAMDKNARNRKLVQQQREIEARVRSLTPREREVMVAVIAGKATKMIAAEMSVSLQTVAKHRSRVIDKMLAENDAELIHLDFILRTEVR